MGFKKEDFPSLFFKALGKPLKKSVLLRNNSNFKIGGKADYFFEAFSKPELVNAVRIARECGLPYYVIGGGYNVLFDDEGFHGLIIKNEVKGLSRLGLKEEIEVFSGTPLKDLVQFCLKDGLSGFEFLAGIPGTVGGAVFGNAGAFRKSIGNFLKRALLLNERGEEMRVEKEYFAFHYRHSFLKKKHDLVLKVVFALKEGNRQIIKMKIEENLEKRRKKHPPQDIACAGSYFKNPILPDGSKVAAAYLLDQVGARGLKVGRATVYPAHANFIINLGGASSHDVLSLAKELKKRVKVKYGIKLEEEVFFLPANSSMP